MRVNTKILLAFLSLPCQALYAQFSGSARVQGGAERPPLGVNQPTGAVYFVHNGTDGTAAGSDSNDGASPQRPWKTLTHFRAMVPILKSGDIVRLKRGDVFRESLSISNTVSVTSTATTQTTNPMPGAGITISAYGTASTTMLTDGNGIALPGLPSNDPIIDGADPVSLTWTKVSGNVWKSPLASCPVTLFPSAGESVPYVPVPNYVGNFDSTNSASTIYNCMDEVYYATTSGYYENATGGPLNAVLSPNNLGQSWTQPPTTPFPGVYTTTTAMLTQSGTTNVAACTMNCFYYDGTYVYVYQADGTTPNSTMYAGNTARPYGIQLVGTTGVNVNHIQFAHNVKGGLRCSPYGSTAYAYFPCENMEWHHLAVYDFGDVTGKSPVAQQVGTQPFQGGIIIDAGYDTIPHLEVGNKLHDNYSGRSLSQAGAAWSAYFQDGTQTVGGVTTNRPVISNSRAVNTGICIFYQGTGSKGSYPYTATQPAGSIASAANPTGLLVNWNPTSHNYASLSKGGLVSNNECSGFIAGAIFYSSVMGGEIKNNYLHDGYGEGVQLGGGSTSSYAGDYTTQKTDFNIFSNTGYTPYAGGYNAIDSNNGGSATSSTIVAPTANAWGPITVHQVLDDNTIINPVAGGITAEPGEQESEVMRNAIDMSSNGSLTQQPHPENPVGQCSGNPYYSIQLSVALGNGPQYMNNAIGCTGPTSNYVIQLNGATTYAAKCANLSSFWQTQNANSPSDNSKCDMTAEDPSPAWFVNKAAGNFTPTAGSFVTTVLTSGAAVGALQVGQTMFSVGPQVDPNLYQ